MATRRLVAIGIRNPEDCAAALALAFKEAQLRKATLLAVHGWHSRIRAPPKPGQPVGCQNCAETCEDLTPTQKVRRNYALARYASDIDTLYA
jgi:long-subunit acyl-CoA synthetase (AMP-forming)